MMKEKAKKTQQFEPEIKLAPMATLKIFQISESELDSIHKGSINSTLLNLCIFFLSVGLSLLIVLLTTAKSKDNLYISFYVGCVVGFILGLFYLIYWIITLIKGKSLIKTIKKRLPPEGTQKKMAS